jgi:arylsulfatase A-like enzyme
MPEIAAHVAAVGESFADRKNWRVGIRTSEWKYAFAPRNPGIPEELYNLRTDPHEWRNLAKKHRSMAAELREQVLDMISGTYYVSEDEQGEEMSEREKIAMEERLKQLGYL